MGFEAKTPNLLALLNAHADGNIPAIAVVSRSVTPAISHTLPIEAADKNRKRAHGGKGTKGAEEGEVTKSSH